MTEWEPGGSTAGLRTMPSPTPLDYRSVDPPRPPRHPPEPWREWASIIFVCLIVLAIVTVLLVILAGLVFRDLFV